MWPGGSRRLRQLNLVLLSNLFYAEQLNVKIVQRPTQKKKCACPGKPGQLNQRDINSPLRHRKTNAVLFVLLCGLKYVQQMIQQAWFTVWMYDNLETEATLFVSVHCSTTFASTKRAASYTVSCCTDKLVNLSSCLWNETRSREYSKYGAISCFLKGLMCSSWSGSASCFY